MTSVPESALSFTLSNVKTSTCCCGVQAGLICAELTESALMEDPRRARETLAQRDDLGLKLSMGDYGTGNSSLAYIKDLSMVELKIDRAFVRGMNNDAQRAAMVHSTIELGRAGNVID